MSKILTFPAKHAQQPDYVGRVLALNIEKARKFQTGGFSVGPSRQSAVVEAGANQEALRRAVQEGVLLDITDNQELRTQFTNLSKVSDSETDKRCYFASAAILRKAGIQSAMETDSDGSFIFRDSEVLCYMTSDESEKSLIEQHLPVRLALPPGMDNPEKYLIGVDK